MAGRAKTLDELAAEYGVPIETARVLDTYAQQIAAAIPPPDEVTRKRIWNLFTGAGTGEG